MGVPLPFVAVPENRCQPEKSADNGSVRSFFLATARVLIVDDEPLFLDVLDRTLSRAGYEVLPASGPRRALEIIRNEPPVDLILSDVEMPEMRGTELVREIARISPQTAAMLITGYISHSAKVPEGVPLLQKPISIRDLISAVQAALARSAELRAELQGTQERSAELRRESWQLRSEAREAISMAADRVWKARNQLEPREQQPKP